MGGVETIRVQYVRGHRVFWVNGNWVVVTFT